MLNEGVPKIKINQKGKYMKAFIVSNEQLQNDYYRIRFDAPEMAAKSGPGQFVHVRIDERNDNILRRPFSIHNAENGIITVVYKVVGTGTERLKEKLPGDSCDLIGPVGVGFSTPEDDVIPVAVCGGYGAAATFMLTRGNKKGILLLGAIAFSLGTAAGVIFAKIMNIFSKEKINPLIGAAGVSAVPMAARVANKVGQESDPGNFLLMHAMGPNVAGVIGSAVAAGVLLNMLKGL